jgi:hypothetical protein
MKHNKSTKHLDLKSAPLPIMAPDYNQNMTAFVPSPDEVSRRAYFSYVKQGSVAGHDVQHWLDAEAQLIAERNITRAHGFHNRT